MEKIITGFVIGFFVMSIPFLGFFPAIVNDIKSFEIEGVSGIRLYKKGTDTIWIEQPEKKAYICFEIYLGNLEKQQGKATAELMKVKIRTVAGWYDK
ncbi:MAG: hypothetical protein AABW67_03870 [Nanoarchaeota archaeon]